MNTVSRKPHFGHPTRHFISFESSGGAQPFPAAHHYECMSMRCKWQGCFVRRAHSGRATWLHWMGCRGLSGGKEHNTHKEPLRERGRGTRLAPVLLPFYAMAGGGRYLVPNEWTDYRRRIGGRRFIITILYYLDGHCLYFCINTIHLVLCESPMGPTMLCFLLPVIMNVEKQDIVLFVLFDKAISAKYQGVISVRWGAVKVMTKSD